MCHLPYLAGKSALVLEAARYMRQRNRFPHGIFCCSLEGLRSMKVRGDEHAMHASALDLCPSLRPSSARPRPSFGRGCECMWL